MKLTFTQQVLTDARNSGRVCPGGVAYVVGIAGKGTAAITLLKEPHHTSEEMKSAKRWLIGKWRLCEISTHYLESSPTPRTSDAAAGAPGKLAG